MQWVSRMLARCAPPSTPHPASEAKSTVPEARSSLFSLDLVEGKRDGVVEGQPCALLPGLCEDSLIEAVLYQLESRSVSLLLVQGDLHPSLLMQVKRA